jgi:hypothetical protein
MGKEKLSRSLKSRVGAIYEAVSAKAEAVPPAGYANANAHALVPRRFADGIALRLPSSTRLALLAYSVRSAKQRDRTLHLPWISRRLATKN